MGSNYTLRSLYKSIDTQNSHVMALIRPSRTTDFKFKLVKNVAIVLYLFYIDGMLAEVAIFLPTNR